MSRTKKGKKPPGYEYWGRGHGSMRPPGAYSKRLQHRGARRDAKSELAVPEAAESEAHYCPECLTFTDMGPGEMCSECNFDKRRAEIDDLYASIEAAFGEGDE